MGFSLVPKADFLEQAGSEENHRKEKTLEQQCQDGWNWKPLRELARLRQRCGTRQKLNMWLPSSLLTVNTFSSCIGVGVYTGPAGGQDGTPKKKTVKKSVASESTVPPVPTLKEQGDSDLGHPGKPQRVKAVGNEALDCIAPLGPFLNNSSCFGVEVGVL